MKMKPLIYQIFTRLYGNENHTNQIGGTIEMNGCAKIKNITAAQLNRISDFGFTHVWFTGLLEHATHGSCRGRYSRSDFPVR